MMTFELTTKYLKKNNKYYRIVLKDINFEIKKKSN